MAPPQSAPRLAPVYCSVSTESPAEGEPAWRSLADYHFSSPRDEVNKAYRKLAVLLHPDKCVAPGSEDAFKAVVNARTALLKNIK